MANDGAVAIKTMPVLVGGKLKFPVVPALREEFGKFWIGLSKEDKVVLHFLTGRCKWTRPLKGVTVIDKLIKLRNHSRKSSEEDVDDCTTELALDAPPASAPAKRRRKNVQNNEPPDENEWLPVELPLPNGETWKVDVLRAGGKHRVHIEFSEHNMQCLYDIASADLQDQPASGDECVDVADGIDTSPPPKSGIKGLHWLAARGVWDIRYKGEDGKMRCKTFKPAKWATPAEFDVACEAAKQEAIKFMDTLST